MCSSDLVGGAAWCLIDFDATIARLVVVTRAVSHAVDGLQRCSEQFAPLAVEGNDDWVALGSNGRVVGISRTNLHMDSKTKKEEQRQYDQTSECR